MHLAGWPCSCVHDGLGTQQCAGYSPLESALRKEHLLPLAEHRFLMSGKHLYSDGLRTYLLEVQECLGRDRGAFKNYKHFLSVLRLKL